VYTADVLLVEDNVYEAELTIRSLKKNNMGGRLLHLEDAQDALDYYCPIGKGQTRAFSKADNGKGTQTFIPK